MALERLDQAVRVLRRVGAAGPLATALALRSTVFYTLGRPEAGIPSLYEARRLVSSITDPHLESSILQNLALSLVASERYREAEGVLPQVRELCQQTESREGFLQLRWLEGLSALGQGQLIPAERALRAAMDGFVSLGSTAHVALLGLDLASVLLRLGRSREGLGMAAKTTVLIESLDYSNEVMVALNLLQESLEQGVLSEELLLDIRRRLNISHFLKP